LQCPGYAFKVDAINRVLCFKISADGTSVQYQGSGGAMESVFQSGNSVIYTPDLSKYSASNPGTYQVLTGKVVDKLTFSTGVDDRLIIKLALLKSAKTTSGATIATSGDSTQDNLRTSVIPDMARSSTMQVRSAIN
jgi:hypothetical protein